MSAEITQKVMCEVEAISSGMVNPADLAEVKNLLFLCWGNICRSPFCHHIWNNLGHPVEARSAGFIESEDRATPGQYRVMAALHGVDLSSHGSRWASPELIAWADAIIVMDEKNFDDLRRLYPEAVSKTMALGDFLEPAEAEISDPYFLPPNEARRVYQQMRDAVEALAVNWR